MELQADQVDVDLTSVESLVDGSPIINLVNYLILQSLRKGASDIHIEPTRKHTIVRFRVDGQLIEVLRPRRDIHAAIVSRIKVMGKMDIAEHRIPQDGRCQVAVEGKEVDMRISTLPTVLGEKVVLRVLDRRRLTFSLEKLGLPPHLLSLDPALGRQIIDLHIWAVRQGLRGSAVEALFDGFCQRLVIIGVPLWRGFVGMRTLHPQWGGYGYTWRRDLNAIEQDRFERGSGTNPDWQVSPFNYLINRSQLPNANGVASLRRHLAGRGKDGIEIRKSQ